MASAELPESYVGLNVGGKIYQTSRATLARYADTFFTTILDGETPSVKDGHGNIMIDRDGKMFRHILNFLRNGKIILPDGFNELELLEGEADFFLIEEFKNELRWKKMELKKRSDTELFGFSVKGKIYKLERRHLLREHNSLFSKLLSGDVRLPLDCHGNFVIERDVDEHTFDGIVDYLQKGFIATEYTEEEAARLQTEAQFYELKILSCHIHDLRFVRKMSGHQDRQMHWFVYYYTNQTFGSLTDQNEPMTLASSAVTTPGCIAYLTNTRYFNKISTIQGDGNSTCHVVDLKKIKEKGSASLEDVISFFKRTFEPHRNTRYRDDGWIVQEQIGAYCTRLEINLIDDKHDTASVAPVPQVTSLFGSRSSGRIF